MPRNVTIAPSILSADFGRMAEDVSAVAQAGADWIHYDVMDGRFVPNITVGPDVLAAVGRATTLPLDVHLMIVEPERHIEAFAKAGAEYITVHAEATTHLHRTLQAIHQLGCKAGVSLNPATGLDAVQHVIEELDLLLIMTVNPGFGGQKFIGPMVPKISDARELIDSIDREIHLEVDGGVTVANIAEVCDAGASAIVSGTGIFKTDSYADTIADMRRRVASPQG
jgi:ribulose-phosphate 3-epimerase